MHAFPSVDDVFTRFRRQASRRPEAPAVAWKDCTTSYAALLRRAEQLSAQLRGMGVGPETVVGIRMQRCDELVVAMLAVLDAGGAYLPLDPSIPIERASYMLECSAATVLLADAAHDTELTSGSWTVVTLGGATSGAGGAVPALRALPEQLAYVLFTSGSTGRPKGVQISRAAFSNAIACFERLLDATSQDVFLSVTGISFDIFGLELMLPLCTGGLLVLAERERLLETGYLADLAAQRGATLFQTTPTLARNLLDTGWQPHAAMRVLMGGEALTADLARRLDGAHSVFNVYGPTEATIWVSADHVATRGCGTPPIGTALDNTCLLVLDSFLDVVPAGLPGELYIGGMQLARGYAGRPDLTAEKFVPSPFDAGKRLYRTGDLVRRSEDGTLEYLGRVDQQIKLRGHRIELGEIEEVISSHPGVAGAVTVVREDMGRDPLLVTYYTVNTKWLDNRADAALEAAQTAAWEDIYDGRYAQEGDGAGDGDHSVWIDSRSGEPYTPEQMQEWIDTTVQRISGLGARRILEIGCGSGQLLLRLAPGVDRYVGTDISAAALRVLQRKTAGMPHTELRHMPAHRTGELAGERFDLVVINSVAQYFPSASYLMDVLRQAKGVLAPDGVLFIGDVRHHGLLDAFYATVEMRRAGEPLEAAQVCERVARRAANESELCLDPAFFVAVKETLGFGSAQLLSRRGEADTEMNSFRFDAVLRMSKPDSAQSNEASTVAWQAENWSALHFQELLRGRDHKPLRINGLPDARTSTGLAALRMGTLRARARGFRPDALIRIAGESGFGAMVGTPTAHGAFDMLLVRGEVMCLDVDFPFLGSAGECACELANRPLQPQLLRMLEDEVRAQALHRLPEYMVPSRFVRIDRFPLNTSGKLDRGALPRPHVAVQPAAPLDDENQRAIASCMAEVLGLAQQPGPEADFFRLGGHSLAAVRLAARLRERFGAAFDLHAVFELRTVKALAQRLRGRVVSGTAAIAAREYPDGARVPLSRAQAALWFVNRLHGAAAAYNIPLAVRIEGPLDASALRRAMAQLLARHQSLRTTCTEADGAPTGVVHAAPEFDLPLVEASRDLDAELVESARAPFDLERDPMLRAALFRIGPREHVLLIVVHHIAADGLSMAVLARDIGDLYGKESGVREVELPPSTPYADFAHWEPQALSARELEEQLAWWRWHLAGAPTVLELPLDHHRPAITAHRGSFVRVQLPPEMRTRIERFAQEHDVTAFSVLLAAFGALLGRLGNQQEVVVGVAAGGRSLRDFEQTVGLFANVLPVRINALATATAAQSAREVGATLREAMARQAVTFDRIVEHLGIPRTLERAPLVQAGFTFVDEKGDLHLPGLRTEPVPLHLHTSRLDLTLQLAPSTDGGWTGLFEYDSDLFERTTIARWAGHFEHLLFEITRNDRDPLADLPLAKPTLSIREPAWDATRPEDIVTSFERQCAMRPHALALVAGNERLTFAQLRGRAAQVAHALRGHGTKPGDVIALHMDRNAELVAAIWGVLKLGAVFLPIDLSAPMDRVRQMLARSGANWVISDSIGDVTVGTCRQLHPRNLFICAPANEEYRAHLPGGMLAYVIFTSGSTGEPKGVQISRDAIGEFCSGWTTRMSLGHRSACLSAASIAFDIFLIELLPMHCVGACVVLADRQKLLEMSYIQGLMRDERVSFLTVTPSLLAAWTGMGWAPDRDLQVVAGGEAIPAEFAARLAGQCELWNGYGPTEAACAQTSGRLLAPLGTRAPIGTAFGRNEMFVLDGRLNPVPVGAIGELYIAGPQLAQGYAGRADLTAERFIPSPFHTGERLYRTGDLARWLADGRLEHCGRCDDQVKVRGYRIELGEIEARLLGCAAVAAAAVVVQEDAAANKRLLAYVVPEQGRDIDIAAIESQLAGQLPAYMMPSYLAPLARLPMTRNGKVDKKALPAPDWPSSRNAETGMQGDSLEGRLALLMSQVLGMDRKLGPQANFFAAGGHSLAAVRLAAEVGREFGTTVPLRSFFEDPTPAGLARHVRGTDKVKRRHSPFARLGVASSATNVFLVHGADGYAINFRELGRALPQQLCLWGIDGAHSWLPNGALDGLGIAELGRLYADRLLHDFPQLREIHIGGWSAGGLIALEMARHLRDLGCDVPTAFAVDSAIRPRADDLRSASAVDTQALVRRNMLEAGHGQAEVDATLDSRTAPGAIDDLYVALDSYAGAAARFEPAPYEGDFTLFAARAGLAVNEAAKARWHHVVQGRLRIVQVEGGHFSVLREPAVSMLAHHVADCVLKADTVEL